MILDEKDKQIQSLREEKDYILALLATSLMNQMQTINKWSEGYYKLSKHDKDPYRYLDADAYKDKERFIRQFCQSLETIRKEEAWFSQLEEALNMFKDNIMKDVRETSYIPGKKVQVMSEDDFRTLLLMFAGLPDKSIAFFLGMNYGTVRMRRHRYKEFFSQMPANKGQRFFEAL